MKFAVDKLAVEQVVIPPVIHMRLSFGAGILDIVEQTQPHPTAAAA